MFPADYVCSACSLYLWWKKIGDGVETAGYVSEHKTEIKRLKSETS